MTAIKPFTDIEQSKKLAEILPLKSADMYYLSGDEYDVYFGSGLYEEIADWYSDGTPKPADIPCWSLAALLGVYPMTVGRDMDMYCCWQNSKNLHSRHYNNPIDACYELILRLHELNLL